MVKAESNKKAEELAAIKIVLMEEGGKLFYARNPDVDMHTQFGFIASNDLKKKPGTWVKSNTGHAFVILKPRFIDFYKKMRRLPQIIPLKDIAVVVAETGIGRNDRVLDAGTGSGGIACFLANIAKEVVSYEVRKDFYKLAQKNVKELGLKNVKLKNKDVYNGIDEKNLDVILLDLPAPWRVVKHAETALKPGGFLISYSPTLPQVMDFVDEIKRSCFVHVKTLETIQREWEVDARRVRPKSQPIGHSGFLTVCRKTGIKA